MNLCTPSQRQNSVRDINFIIFSRAHEASFSYSVTHIALTCHLQYYWQQRELRHSALNWDFFYVLLTSKRGNIAFPPPIPYIKCSAAVQVTYRKQKTPQLWMEGTRGGVWMLLFPQVTLFAYTVPAPLSPIVPNGYKSYMCLDLLTSSLMNVSRDSCAFSTSCGGPSRETLSFSSLNSTWTWNQVNWLLNTVKPLQMGTSLQRPCSRYPAEYQELSMPNDWPAYTSHGLIGQSG